MKILKQFQRPERIKVLILAKHVDGGTGTFVGQIMRLEKTEIQTLVLEKPQHRNIASVFQIKYFSNNRLLPYYYVFTPSAILHLVRELIWLTKEIDRFQPNIILAIDNHCNLLVCLCKVLFRKYKKIKLILTIHNNISAVTFAKLPRWSRYIFQAVSRGLFVQASEIVCVSRGVARDAKRFFSLPRLPKVIYYGVDVQKIQQLSRQPIDRKDEAIFKTKTTKIISIGRFAPQKDFLTLIEAFSMFCKKRQDADLFLIGDGQDKEKLVECVKRHSVEKHVHFLGWKQNVYPYMKAADVFVLSSHYEGFPFVLLEAAALGKPIVATDTPYGPKELLGNNRYGLVVPMKTPHQQAEALLLLINRKTYTHYQAQIIKRARGFSEKSMIKRYQALTALA